MYAKAVILCAVIAATTAAKVWQIQPSEIEVPYYVQPKYVPAIYSEPIYENHIQEPINFVPQPVYKEQYVIQSVAKPPMYPPPYYKELIRDLRNKQLAAGVSPIVAEDIMVHPSGYMPQQ